MDWTLYLAGIATNETIVSSTWTVSGPDSVLTTASPSIITGSLKTQVFIAAGTSGALYTLTNRITTSSGVIDDRSIHIRVAEK